MESPVSLVDPHNIDPLDASVEQSKQVLHDPSHSQCNAMQSHREAGPVVFRKVWIRLQL